MLRYFLGISGKPNIAIDVIKIVRKPTLIIKDGSGKRPAYVIIKTADTNPLAPAKAVIFCSYFSKPNRRTEKYLNPINVNTKIKDIMKVTGVNEKFITAPRRM